MDLVFSLATLDSSVTGLLNYILLRQFVCVCDIVNQYVIMMTASSGNVMWRPSVRPSVSLSVCPVSILTVNHQGTACNAASVHFGATIRRTDVLVS